MGVRSSTGLYKPLVHGFGLDPDVIEEVDDGRSWCPAEGHTLGTDRPDKLTHCALPSSQTQGTLEAECSVPWSSGSLAHIGFHQCGPQAQVLPLRLAQAVWETEPKLSPALPGLP